MCQCVWVALCVLTWVFVTINVSLRVWSSFYSVDGERLEAVSVEDLDRRVRNGCLQGWGGEEAQSSESLPLFF